MDVHVERRAESLDCRDSPALAVGDSLAGRGAPKCGEDAADEAPVAALDLANADQRRSWAADKHMVAVTFHRPGRPLDEVDVLIDPPLSFSEMAAGADVVEAEGVRRLLEASGG
jgi:hypothetical protein